MFTAEYYEHLLSPYWLDLKDLKLEEQGYRCAHCSIGGISLDLHHKTYKRFPLELLEDVEALCPCCHEEADAMMYEERVRRREAALRGVIGDYGDSTRWEAVWEYVRDYVMARYKRGEIGEIGDWAGIKSCEPTSFEEGWRLSRVWRERPYLFDKFNPPNVTAADVKKYFDAQAAIYEARRDMRKFQDKLGEFEDD